MGNVSDKDIPEDESQLNLMPTPTGCAYCTKFVGIAADDVANMVDTLGRTSQAATEIPGETLIMYLIRNIVKHAILSIKSKKGQICKRCYKTEVSRSWNSFISFCVPTIASILTGLLISSSGHLIGIQVPLSIQTSIQQALQIVTVNNISGKGMRQKNMKPVRSWEELIPGHMVEFKYYWTWYQGILTEVNPRLEKIKVVRYRKKHWFATRTILEDETKVNLKKENFYIYHPDPEYAYTPEEVIRKAKSRLGEHKLGRGYRSYDFCRACVLRERSEN